MISTEQARRNANGGRRATANAHYSQGSQRIWRCRAKQRTPRLDLVKEGEAIAFDVEGVQLPNETGSLKRGVGRVSVVNERGQVVYDTFAFYPDSVYHEPSPARFKLGVKAGDIVKDNGAQPIGEILKTVEIICNKAGVVVCHAINNEIDYLSSRQLIKTDGTTIDLVGFDLQRYRTYDTQTLPEYRDLVGGNIPSLKKLVPAALGRAIQVNEHSSVEDAQATMELFLRRRRDFEAMASPINGSTPISGSASATSLSSQTTTEENDVPDLSTLKLSNANEPTATEPSPTSIIKPASEKLVVSGSSASVAKTPPKPAWAQLAALPNPSANANHKKLDMRASRRA